MGKSVRQIPSFDDVMNDKKIPSFDEVMGNEIKKKETSAIDSSIGGEGISQSKSVSTSTSIPQSNVDPFEVFRNRAGRLGDTRTAPMPANLKQYEKRVNSAAQKIYYGDIKPSEIRDLVNDANTKEMALQLIRQTVPEVGEDKLLTDEAIKKTSQKIAEKNRINFTKEESNIIAQGDSNILESLSNISSPTTKNAGQVSSYINELRADIKAIDLNDNDKISDLIQKVKKLQTVEGRNYLTDQEKRDAVNETQGIINSLNTRLYHNFSKKGVSPTLNQLDDQITSAVLGKEAEKGPLSSTQDQLTTEQKVNHFKLGLTAIEKTDPILFNNILNGVSSQKRVADSDYSTVARIGQGIENQTRFRGGAFDASYIGTETDYDYTTFGEKKADAAAKIGEWMKDNGYKNMNAFPEKLIRKAAQATGVNDESIVKSLVFEEGLPGYDAIPKSGWMDDVYRGASTVLEGINSTIQSWSESPSETYLRSKSLSPDVGSQKVQDSEGGYGDVLASEKDKFSTNMFRGVGQFIPQILLTKGVGGALSGATRAVGVPLNAATARNVTDFGGTAISTFLQSYGPSYEEHLQKTGDADEAALIAAIDGTASSAFELLLPDVRIADKAFKGLKGQLATDLMSVVKKGGDPAELAAKARPFVQKFFTNAAGTLIQENAEEIGTQYVDFVTESLFDPESAKNRDLSKELWDTFKATTAAMTIPSILGGVGQSFQQDFTRQTLHSASINFDSYKESLQNSLDKGYISQNEYNGAISLISTNKQSIEASPKNNINGKSLSAKQRLDYAYEDTKIKVYKEKIENTDGVAKEMWERKIKEAEDIQREIVMPTTGQTVPGNTIQDQERNKETTLTPQVSTTSPDERSIVFPARNDDFIRNREYFSEEQENQYNQLVQEGKTDEAAQMISDRKEEIISENSNPVRVGRVGNISPILNRINNADYINENELNSAADELYTALDEVEKSTEYSPAQKQSAANFIEPLISKIEGYEFRTTTQNRQVTEERTTQVPRPARTREVKTPLERASGTAVTITNADGTTTNGILNLNNGEYSISSEGQPASILGQKEAVDINLSLPTEEEVPNFIEFDENDNVSAVTVKTGNGSIIKITDPEAALDIAIQLRGQAMGEFTPEEFDTVYEKVVKNIPEEVLVESENNKNQANKDVSEIEKQAKLNGIWYEDIEKSFGDPQHKGSESVVWEKKTGNKEMVVKAISENKKYSINDRVENIKLHNELFPETPYKIIGYGKLKNGKEAVIAEQPKISIKRPATDEELDSYLTKKGFKKDGVSRFDYVKGDTRLSDLNEDNVVIGNDNKIYFIDPQISKNKKEALKNTTVNKKSENLTREEKVKSLSNELRVALGEATLPLSISSSDNNRVISINLNGNNLDIKLSDISLEPDEKGIDFSNEGIWNRFNIKANGETLGFIEVKAKGLDAKVALALLYPPLTPEQNKSIYHKIIGLLDNIFIKPFRKKKSTGLTNTGKGIGKYSYQLLATKLKKEYGRQLVSDIARTDHAENLWKRFEKEGKAIKEGDYYRFIESENGSLEMVIPDPKGNLLNRVSFQHLGIKDGDTIQTVVDKVMEAKGPFTPILQAIRLDKNFKDLRIKLHPSNGGTTPSGLYNPQGEGAIDAGLVQIWDQGNVEYALAHELMHFFTLDSQAAETARNSNSYKFLEGIYNYISSNKGKPVSGLATVENYGLTNFKEFMAELLINPTFRNSLSDLYANNYEEIAKADRFVRDQKGGSIIDIITNLFKDLINALRGKTDQQGVEFNPSEAVVDRAAKLMTDLFFQGNDVVNRDSSGSDGSTVIGQNNEEGDTLAIGNVDREAVIKDFVARKLAEGEDREDIRESLIDLGISEDQLDRYFPSQKSKRSTENKSIIGRINNSEKISDSVKEKLSGDLRYTVKNQAEARSFAKNIIKEFGIDQSLNLAESGRFHGDVNSMIFAESIDQLYNEEQTANTPEEKEDAAERYADAALRYQDAAESGGRFISAIHDFYKKSPTGLVIKAQKEFDRRNNEYFKGREKNTKDALNDLVDTIEGNDLTNDSVSDNKKADKKPIFAPDAERKVKSFFKNLKIDTRGSAGSYLLPPQIFNAAIDIIEKSVLAGLSIGRAIDAAIDYIGANYTEAWKVKEFKADIRKGFKAQDVKPILTTAQKEKILKKWERKLVGLTSDQKQSLLNKSFMELMDKGALNYDTFKRLYAEAAGLPHMTPELSDKLQNLAKAINKPDDLKEEILKAQTTDKVNEYKQAVIDAEKASRELNDLIGREKRWYNTFLTVMRLNLLGSVSLAGNVVGNVANLPFRFFSSLTATGLDYLVSGAQLTSDKLFGTSLYKNTPTHNSFKVQGGYWRGQALGTKQAIGQVISGVSNKDLYKREIKQNIRPIESAKKFIGSMTGKERLDLNGKINAFIEAFPTGGMSAEVIARLLNVGDRGFRFGAEMAEAERVAQQKGLIGKQKELFILFPDEQSKERIEQAGATAVFQQDNWLSDAIDKVLNAVGSKQDDPKWQKAIGLAIKGGFYSTQPFLKTPLNVFVEFAHYAVPAIPLVRAGIAMVNKKPDIATYHLGQAVVGFSALLAATSMVANGLIVPSGDADEEAKERLGIAAFQRRGQINISGLKRFLAGSYTGGEDEDVWVELRYLGFGGMLLLAKADQYKRNTKEEIEQQNLLMDMVGMFGSPVKSALTQGVFGGTMSMMNAASMGGGYVDNWLLANMEVFTNAFNPKWLRDFGAANNDYLRDTKGMTLSEAAVNRLNNNFSLFGGSGLPSKVNIWGDKVEAVPSGVNPYLYNYFGILKSNSLDNDKFGFQLYDYYNETKDYNIFPPALKREINGHKLTGEQFEQYSILIGSHRKQLVSAYFEGGFEEDKASGKEVVIKRLGKIYGQARKLAVWEFTNLYPELQKKQKGEEDDE